MTPKEENYNIHIGRHFIKNVSLPQLKNIYELIRNFREQENEIPVASATKNSKVSSPNTIFIAKDTCFDSLSLDFLSEYAIHIGDDSLTNISDKDLINLYFTIRSFLIRSEGLLEEDRNSLNQTIEQENALSIEIADTPIDNCSALSCEHSPYIFRRVWTTDKISTLQYEYGLSTENGTIWDMSQQQLSTLQKKIEDLLNYIDDKK